MQAIFECLCGSVPVAEYHHDEKQAILPREPRTAEEVAEQVVQAIISAEKGGPVFQQRLNNIVGECGWTERVAEWVLVKLETVLREASKLSPVLRDAYDKACEAAKATRGFVMEHPVFCTLIALGVLVVIAPWAVEALGFGELGPVEGMVPGANEGPSDAGYLGTFAAAWQARYAGYVPKGSLFSFFQRLGMTWR